MIFDSGCRKCNLWQSCSSVCLPGKGGSGKLMIVLDYPSQQADLKGVPSQDDSMFWGLLENVLSLKRENIYVTYLVKCRPADGKPSSQEAYKCLSYLREEIKEVNPSSIVVLGDLSFKTVCGETGISKNRGKVYEIPFDLADGTIERKKIVPTYSMRYAETKPEALKDIAMDIQQAVSIGNGEEIKGTSTDTVLVDDSGKLYDLINYVHTTKDFCYDFETFSKLDSDKKAPLNHYSDNFDVSVLSVSFQHHSSYVIPLHHFDSPWSKEGVMDVLSKLNSEVLMDSSIDKIAHNMKFDRHCWSYFGFHEMKGIQYDTMLMHHILNENDSHGLKDITGQIFPEYRDYEQEIKKFGGWGKVPLTELSKYAGIDTDLTLRLKTHFLNELLKTPRLHRLYRNLVGPSIDVLFKAEREGCLIDTSFAKTAIEEAQVMLSDQDKVLRSFSSVKRFDIAKEQQARVLAISNQKEKLGKALDKESESRKRKANAENTKLKAAEARDKRNHALEGRIKERLLALEKPCETVSIKMAKEKLRNLTLGITSVYKGLNFDSPPQLCDFLYGEDGLNKPLPYVRGKGHMETTEKKYLEQLTDYSGFLNALFLHRTMQKTLSTYLVGVYDRCDRNKRVHPSFLQHGTVTGRLSCRNPNLQNVPRGAKLKDASAIKLVSQIKKLFVPIEGHTLLQVDYSQGELRVAAEFGNEETMLKAYREGLDIHSLTGQKVSGLSDEEWENLDKDGKKRKRSDAKAVNFGFIYGLGVDGFIEYAKNNYGRIYSKDEATVMRNNYFHTYNKLTLWHADYVARAQANGYVETLFGRRRRLPDILHPDDFKRSEAERAAINSPIQGTLGEITVFAMCILANRLDSRVRLMNTVHDSILYYVPDNLLESTIKVITDTCENLPMKEYFGRTLSKVSMEVDIELSKKSWGDLEEYQG